MAWRRIKAACLGLALLSSAAVQADMYCCQDASSGRRVCGDSLPEQCRGKAFKVLDRVGNVIKEVGPPLSTEQKAQAAAEAERKKKEEALQQEQRRKDIALLDTYSSVQDIERARSRSEGDVQASVKQMEAKIAALQKQRKKLENEADFYRNKPLPPEVAKGLRDTDGEIKSYLGLIDAKKVELERIHAKYDEDQRRYLELTTARR